MKQLVFAKCDTINVKGDKEIAFGKDNALPWGHVKKDMQNFSKRTENTNLVMGPKTFMSLDKPLKGRPHIVVLNNTTRALPMTKSNNFADYYISDIDFETLLKTGDCPGWTLHTDLSLESSIRLPCKDISIIGGKGILEMALPHIDRVVVSSINKRHYVPSDVKINPDFINKIKVMHLIESHYWKIDELTELTESVYGK